MENPNNYYNSHPLAVAFLELAHLRSLLDPEVDLVGVLAHHLQLDVLSLIGHPEAVNTLWTLEALKIKLSLYTNRQVSAMGYGFNARNYLPFLLVFKLLVSVCLSRVLR